MLIDKKIPKIILFLIGSIISVCVNSQVNSPQKPIKFVVITAAGGERVPEDLLPKVGESWRQEQLAQVIQ